MFKDLSNALALISPAQSGSQSDYSNVSPDQILNDPFFRRDVIENARGQGMVDFSFEEALSEWYNEQSYAELNEIGAVFGDAGYLKTEGLQYQTSFLAQTLQKHWQVQTLLTHPTL